jgi:alpha-mannosidase
MNNNTQPTEAEIRSELGIPPLGSPKAQKVIILSQSSHLDWDWRLPFPTLLDNQPPEKIPYFNDNTRPASEIFTDAAGFLSANPAYYYSICEMGFLEGFAAKYPATFATLKQAGDNLRIVGGGITSPDNLLPDGECFIRNYLLGKQWLDANLTGLSMNLAWLPDDFGHDSQLPVLMQALGFEGVGFGRIPQTEADSLMNSGVDFIWQAADGSTTFAHWMQFSYSQGGPGIGSDPVKIIQGYFDANVDASKTDYVFVPVGDDFAPPQDLPTFAGNYNNNPQPGVYAVAASFDHYVGLIDGFWQRNGTPPPKPFYPTPYWTGYYASRPANKILHHAASRALVGAEVFGKIYETLQLGAADESRTPIVYTPDQTVADGWQTLTPSTHHDYITGTALDAVYTGEQQPLLIKAAAIGDSARQAAAAATAALINAAPQSGETSVAVFNQLGFDCAGLVEMPALLCSNAASVRTSGGTSIVQTAANGDLLFMASAPSLGYDTAYLSTTPVPRPTDPTMYLSSDENPEGTAFALSNHYLTAVVSVDSFGGLSQLLDMNSGTSSGVELLAAGETGNDLAFYIDSGDLYRFGNEPDNDGKYTGTLVLDLNGHLTVKSIEWLEQGPLRLRLQTTVQFNSIDKNNKPVSATYIREYTLVAGEPFLRMSITGGALLTSDGAPTSIDTLNDNPYSVMVRFPFIKPVDALSHGTTYHWDSQLPTPSWATPPTFLASHDFLLPAAVSQYQAVIYHSSIPAWAIDGNGALIGCVLRNTPGDTGLGASGSDTGVHTHHYAIRMPSTAQAPSTGAQLRESLQFQTPLLGTYIDAPTGGFTQAMLSFPTKFSLASVTSGNAIITAAKPAESDSSALILRIYQPTNTPVTVGVSVALAEFEQSLSARQVTALETDIQGQQSSPVNNGAFSFNAEYSLTTLLITNSA